MARYKDVKPLKAIDAAYISGLIDGDGTITLTKRHQNENRQLPHPIDQLHPLSVVAAVPASGTTANHHPPPLRTQSRRLRDRS